jgi:hypothetical protein
MGSAWRPRMVSGPGHGALQMLSVLRRDYTGRTCLRHSGAFSERIYYTLSAQEAAIIAAESLQQALSNSPVSAADEPTIATATSALLQLSAILDTQMEASAPRV